MTYTSQFGAFLLGMAGVIGATVAVCLGHIDSPTYIGLVGPVMGVGVGAGIHAQAVQQVTGNGGTSGTAAS